jgi:DNA-binding CsgD family transcriptional regulator
VVAALVAFQGKAIGLICADWVGRAIPNKLALYECYESVVSDVLGPILLASHELAAIRSPSGRPELSAAARADDQRHTPLTPAELKVAWLAASRERYKLIAARLNKSLSTVDYQLQSIRRKLKVRTYAELAAVLARAGAEHGDVGKDTERS